MIEQLQKFEENNLDDWYEFSETKQVEFLRNLAEYFETNQSALSAYCKKINPKEFSSLSIIYEAVSVYSNKFNDFIFEEIERVIELAKRKDIKPSRIEILEDFEIEDIYEKDFSTYKKIINLLISSLSKDQPDKLNVAILELLDFYLIESVGDDKDSIIWEDQITKFLENSSEKLKAYKSKRAKNETVGKVSKGDRQKWQLLFFVGLISQMIAIFYFRKTVIETNISVGIYFLSGAIGLVVFHKKIESYVSNWFSKLFFSIFNFGGICVMLFLVLNFHLASNEIETSKYEIIEKSSLSGRKYHRSERKPTVYIMLDGVKKEIIYPYAETEMVNNAGYLTIEKSKGLFGFDIIRDRKLE